MTKALELAKFGRETPPTGVVVGDSDAQTLSSKTFSDGPVFSSGAVNAVPYLNASKVFSTSGTFVFDGTNLGVGVASPGYMLHVKGGALGVTSADGTVTSTINYNSLGTITNSDFVFNTNSAERARISSTGLAVTGALTSTGQLTNNRAAGLDSYINHVTTGINNTVMGFNNSGSTNSSGVANNTAYLGSLNTYSTSIVGNGAVIANFVSSAQGAQGISVNGIVNIAQSSVFPAVGFTYNSNGYLYTLAGTSGHITQINSVNVITTTSTGLGIGSGVTPSYKLHAVRTSGGIVGRFDTTTDGITDIYGYGLEITRSDAYIKSTGSLSLGGAAGYSGVVISNIGNVSIGSLQANLGSTSGWINTTYGAIGSSQILSYANQFFGYNLRGYRSTDGGSTNNNFYAMHTASYGFSGIEQAYGGFTYFYTSSTANQATTINTVISPTLAMTIKPGGFVGIGNSDPSARLEIGSWSSGAGLKINYGNASGSVEAVNFVGNGGANGVIGMQMVSAGVGDLWLGGSSGRTLTLYRNGNVGIGAADPAYKLDVVANAATTWAARIYNSNGYQGLLVQSSTASSGILNFGCYNSASYLFVVRDDGNVGVGTSAPTVKLEVASSGTNSLLFIPGSVPEIKSGGANTDLRLSAVGAGGWLALRTDGTDRLYVSSGGNVGIGTGAAPTVKFQTVQTIADWTGDFKNYTAGAYGLRVDLSGSSGTNAALQVYTAAGNGLIVQNNGAVGIGTFNPTAKLQVNNASDSRIIIYETGTSPYTATLELASQAIGTYGGLLQYTSSAETLTLKNYGRTNTNTTQGSILFNTKVANTTDTTVMTIHGFSGYVGIGTTGPSGPLHVHQGSGGPNTITMSTTFGSGNSYAVNPFIQGVSNGGFSIRDVTNGVDRIAIEYSTGNVGIGISQPTAKLHVNGTSSFEDTIRHKRFATHTWDNITGGWYRGYTDGNNARYEIARIAIDYNDWNSVGTTIVEVSQIYYNNGGYSKWMVHYGVGQNYSVTLVESSSDWSGGTVTLGSPVQVSGDVYYLPVYVHSYAYQQHVVRLTTTVGLAADNSVPGQGQISLQKSPTITNGGASQAGVPDYSVTDYNHKINGRLATSYYAHNWLFGNERFVQMRGGKATSTGTYSLFSRGSSGAQSSGKVYVQAIYGTPATAGSWEYVISGNKNISLINSNTSIYGGSTPSIYWSGNTLYASNGDSSTYYTVIVELHNIGEHWYAAFGDFPGFIS